MKGKEGQRRIGKRWFFLSYFLMFFGLLGFPVCIPIYYCSTYVEGAGTLVQETLTMLEELRTLLDETLNLTATVSELDDTVGVINSTMETLSESINASVTSLDDISELLSIVAGNLLLQTLASNAMDAVNQTAGSVQLIAGNLSAISLSMEHAYSNVYESYVDLGNRISYWNNEIHTISASIDSWAHSLESLNDAFEILRYGLYGAIGYILLTHTALILVGLAFRKIMIELQKPI